MPQDMRGLTQYIADLRACKVRELEEKRVNKEMAHIRQKFKEGNLDGYQRKKYLSKIVFTYILGYEVDVGHMESVNLISSSKYSEKQIGYLALTLLMHENSDIVRLVVNSIRKDLDSMDEATNCLALHAIANIGGKEMADSLAVDVHRLLISPTSKSFVKKKAALTLLRLYRKSPECVDAKEWGLRIVSIMDDRNLGVALSVASLVSALAVDNLEDLAVSYQKAVDRLNKIVVEQQYSSDYVYYRVPIPWLQVKLLRLLQLYPPHDDPNIRNLLHNVLRAILENAKETPKNVQHNNAQNAVLFEAISLAIHLDTESSLVHSAAALLGRFVLSKETNVRYLGMDTMAQLASRSESLEVVKRHQDTVIFSLKDRDVSVRRRALDLLYSMCDGSNAKTIVGELLKYLNVADYSLREEMVLKIAIMTEKFATEYEWYVDTILRLMSQAGDYVGEEVWHRIVQIVTNTEELQEYAARKVYDHLRAPACHENVIRVAAYLLGEFGHLIANEDDPSAISPIEQFTLINNRIATSSPSTKALILTTYVKWLNLFPEIRDHIIAVLRKFTHTLDAELQQRACEYLAIAEEEEVLQVVLDEMPPYPEQRESALVGRLIRKHGGKQHAKDTSRRKTTTAKVEETPEHAAEVATQDDLLSGLEGLVLSPAPVATTPGVVAPLPPTAAVSSGTKAATPPLTSGLADTVSESAPLVVQAVQFTHGADKALQRLAYSSEGILWEDAQLQVGLKSEYHGHLGRLALYFGNKISAAFDSFTVTVESQEPAALGVSLPKILPSTLAGTTQMQQVVQLDCKALFDVEKQPILRVSYLAGSLNTLTLKLPVFLNKFIEGVDLGAADFFERWKRVAAGEAQSIYQLKKGDTKRRVKGLGLRILEGIDPNPGNAVGAGVFHTASGKVGCLLRLEPNGEMARLTIRSTDSNVSARLLSITELCTKA